MNAHEQLFSFLNKAQSQAIKLQREIEENRVEMKRLKAEAAHGKHLAESLKFHKNKIEELLAIQKGILEERDGDFDRRLLKQTIDERDDLKRELAVKSRYTLSAHQDM